MLIEVDRPHFRACGSAADLGVPSDDTSGKATQQSRTFAGDRSRCAGAGEANNPDLASYRNAFAAGLGVRKTELRGGKILTNRPANVLYSLEPVTRQKGEHRCR